MHTLFGTVHSGRWYGITLHVPQWETLNVASLAVSVLAALLLLRFKLGILPILAVCCLLGLTVWMPAQ